ncbi:MAG: hypothetical protein EA398_11885 [Deltaproteobacteria bacterium]|nr:MAG: hypothetical protein EA398_11885 [Deltaproteobacteria bacterium]
MRGTRVHLICTLALVGGFACDRGGDTASSAPAAGAPSAEAQDHLATADEQPSEAESVPYPEHVRERMAAAHAGIQACYQDALSDDGGVEGRARFRFQIGADGTVNAVEVPESTLPEEVTACAADAIRAQTFDPPSDGEVWVEHPFVFSTPAGSSPEASALRALCDAAGAATGDDPAAIQAAITAGWAERCAGDLEPACAALDAQLEALEPEDRTAFLRSSTEQHGIADCPLVQ